MFFFTKTSEILKISETLFFENFENFRFLKNVVTFSKMIDFFVCFRQSDTSLWNHDRFAKPQNIVVAELGFRVSPPLHRKNTVSDIFWGELSVAINIIIS